MRKIILIILTLFLFSCKGSNDNGLSNVHNIDEDLNYQKGNELSENKEEVKSLGYTSEQIVDSYYSGDNSKQKIISEWINDENNWRTTQEGDIIEFLNYCEKMLPLNNKNDVWEIIKKYGLPEFDQLLKSKDFINYKESLKEYKETGYYYNGIDTGVIYQYVIDKDIKSSNIALYSIAAIFGYFNGIIDRETAINYLNEDLLNTYNAWFIKFIRNNFDTELSCKDFIKNNGFHKSKYFND